MKNNQKGFAHLGIIILVVAVFGLAGVVMIRQSEAGARTKKRVTVNTIHADRLTPEPLLQKGGQYIVEDNIIQMGSYGGRTDVAKLSSSVNGLPEAYAIYGKGGIIEGAPKATNQKRCFTIRSVNGNAVVEIVSQEGRSKKVNLVAYPYVSGDVTHATNWEYHCVAGAKKKNAPIYAIKHLSGEMVHILQVENFASFRY